MLYKTFVGLHIVNPIIFVRITYITKIKTIIFNHTWKLVFFYAPLFRALSIIKVLKIDVLIIEQGNA